MKTLSVLLSLAFLASCGVSEKLSKNCGSDINMACNAVFGTKDKDQDERLDSNDKKNEEQDARLNALELQNENLIDSITNLTYRVEALETETDGNETEIASLNNTLGLLQSQVNANILAIQSLTSTDSVVELIDPCGDAPGYDEIILKTKSGAYIAYFENGNNRFLSTLGVGSYRTTDGSNCNFSVTNTGIQY